MLFSMHHQRRGLASSSSRTRKIPSFGERRFKCVCVCVYICTHASPLSPLVLLLLLLLLCLLLERRGEEKTSSFFVRGFDATKKRDDDDDDDDDGPDFGV